MNENYDILFENFTKTIDRADPPKLLLHVCCAPCATYCLTRVLPFFDVTLFYSNDNITNVGEWEKRLEQVKKLTDTVNCGNFEVQPLKPLKLQVKPLDTAKFFKAAKGMEKEREGGARCTACFNTRLISALNFAKENGFGLFTTTLTVSPYKNSKALNELGYSIQTDDVKWLPCDFKKRGGYNESIRLSKKYGLYRQHYCGCDFSFSESLSAKGTKN